MNRKIVALALIGLAFGLAGCNITENVNLKEYEMQEKTVDKTIRGRLGPSANENGEYTFTTYEGQKLLHDGKASLFGYEGKNIEVTGQYSGTTLYVDEVKIISANQTGLAPGQ